MTQTNVDQQSPDGKDCQQYGEVDVVDDPLNEVQDDEYPSGLRLVAIVVALILSIFLVSKMGWNSAMAFH